MPAIQHIMVATDFGSSSVKAVHLAAELAARLAARLTVLHVVAARSLGGADASRLEALPAAVARERNAKRELDTFLDALSQRQRPRCDGVVRFGPTAREILAYAEESSCDLIVLGMHRGRRARWLVRSVSESVLRSSPVPVLTVRGDLERHPATLGAAL